MCVLLVAAVSSGVAVAAGSGRGSDTVAPEVIDGSFDDLQAAVSAVDRTRTPDDELDAELEGVADEILGATPSQVDQSRKVFEAEFGPVYVVPLEGGFGVITRESGGVVPGTLGEKNPVAGGLVDPGSGEASYVWGVAIDSVTGVEVNIGDATYAATMVENGFYLIAPKDMETFETLTLLVHLKDGTTVRM